MSRSLDHLFFSDEQLLDLALVRMTDEELERHLARADWSPEAPAKPRRAERKVPLSTRLARAKLQVLQELNVPAAERVEIAALLSALWARRSRPELSAIAMVKVLEECDPSPSELRELLELRLATSKLGGPLGQLGLRSLLAWLRHARAGRKSTEEALAELEWLCWRWGDRNTGESFKDCLERRIAGPARRFAHPAWSSFEREDALVTEAVHIMSAAPEPEAVARGGACSGFMPEYG